MSKQGDAVPRAAYSIEEVAKSLGLSHSIAYRLVRAGEIRSIRVGRRVLVPAQAISDYVLRLQGEAGERN